ncbi:restriction endonuclease subunit S [Citrobacter sp. CK197]|uniref:restriction endonuclease subunit S n=1 Tax=Citrobacter sp. CK197 TaxID=2985106 RepID=UPI00257526A9|nr:restriction endonuclease subunit S [Citrobacter sp. CK197]MDM2983536.1 restriction endonuclease subunit S [Citrobacter sp. CK197]
MSYKAYYEYKSTGIEWPSEIPSFWNMTKLRYVFSFAKGLTITKEHLQDEGIPCVNYGDVHSKYGFEVDPKVHALKYVNEKYLKSNSESLLSKGDLVFADTSEDLDGAGNFTQLITDDIVFAGYHTIIARPLDGRHNRFYAYLLDSEEVRLQIKKIVKGVKVFSITQEILRNISIWLPSEVEQFRISVFLDYETSKINRLICRQERLIELLKEKRQAVISDVVTRGLNLDVKLKISGSEWLGEVPEHWGLSRIGWLCKVGNGSTPNRDNQSYWLSGDYPWLNSSKVNDGIVTSAEQFVTSKALLECSLPLVKKGSVIIAITGEGKTRGTSALLMMDATINQHIAYITPLSNNMILPEYLHLWLENKYEQIRFESSGGGSTKAAITCSDVKKYIIPLPPLNEQKVIVADVEDKKRCFNTLVTYCEHQISLLKERRSALISAAVTGKIDVLNWQPNAKDAA